MILIHCFFLTHLGLHVQCIKMHFDKMDVLKKVKVKKKNRQKMSPHLSQLNVVMAHKMWNNLQILKLAT